MYRFLTRPRWILSHVLVLAVVVAMVNLGLWQYRKYHARQDQNAQITRNSHLAPVPVGTVATRLGGRALGRAQYTAVSVTGTYDPAHEVAIRNHTFNGAPGRWVATPLRPVGGGTPVLVMRGWIPEAVRGTTAPIAGVEPPSGVVTVLGYTEPTETPGLFGAADPTGGRLVELNRVDVARIARQTPGGLLPFWVQLATQDPPTTGARITVVPLPPLDEGPYRSYAYQWALFTLIALIGYPIIIYRVAHGGTAAEVPEDGS